MERRWSKDDFDKGDEVSGLRTGGGFGRRGGGLKGFEPPKSTSGDAAPTLNRQGKTTTPVKPLENAEKKQMYDIERPFRREGDTPREFQNGNQRSKGLDKEELGRIGDYNVQQMREAQAKKAAEKRRGSNVDQAHDTQQTVTQQQMDERKARMQKFGIDPARYGYAKGGKVSAKDGATNFKRGGKINSRDYGK